MKLNEFPQSDDLKQCPCCDYFSLAERGKCLICPVCYWEDDCENPDFPRWTEKSELNNDMTLFQARGNFVKYGACSKKWVDIVIKKEERDTLFYEQRNV